MTQKPGAVWNSSRLTHGLWTVALYSPLLHTVRVSLSHMLPNGVTVPLWMHIYFFLGLYLLLHYVHCHNYSSGCCSSDGSSGCCWSRGRISSAVSHQSGAAAYLCHDNLRSAVEEAHVEGWLFSSPPVLGSGMLKSYGKFWVPTLPIHFLYYRTIKSFLVIFSRLLIILTIIIPTCQWW